MIYYCEIDTVSLKPDFPGYKTEATSDEEALKFFREKHGDRLLYVYDDDFRPVYTSPQREQRQV